MFFWEEGDRKGGRLNSAHPSISYYVVCFSAQRHMLEDDDEENIDFRGINKRPKKDDAKTRYQNTPQMKHGNDDAR